MIEVERLRGAAIALRYQAGRVEGTAGHLRGRVSQTVHCGSWQAPSGERHWQGTLDRHRRMLDAAAMMRGLATRFDQRARELEQEERQRRAAAAR